MAPSRGLLLLFRRPLAHHLPQQRHSSTFTQTLASSPVQIYISRSPSPYLNLSLEHYLLSATPPTSTILFLYTNAPSIILGRNQNPWTEVSLSTLPPTWSLVRRRSGGGTVFHDLGNVNYSVICPSSVFDRDKHASMVVRALQKLRVEGARVNCRHDIVVRNPEGEDKKVSGSAYKLTRLRSLHHGTCLLNSSNLKFASSLLRSPGRGWITARGVESVRSPITNVNVSNSDFETAVVKEFQSLYGGDEPTFIGETEGHQIPEVAKGMEELQSEDWIYNQTPQFTFSTSVAGRENLAGEDLLPKDFSADLTIRHGIITSSSINLNLNLNSNLKPSTQQSNTQTSASLSEFLLNKPLRSITNWEDIFPTSSQSQEHTQQKKTGINPGKAFNTIFGVRQDVSVENSSE